ncbi:MAG: putative Ig domain-containing protein [Syntrophobacteraceae bacterium]
MRSIEGVSLEPSSPITGDQIKARISLASTVQTAPELLYRWKRNGQAIQESPSEVLQSPVKRGDLVEVEVMSAQGSSGTASGVSSYVMVGNAPPALRLAGQTIGNEGSYQGKVDSSDPEGDNFELSIKEGPAGMSIDPAGNIRWVVDSKAEGLFSVAVSARDVHGAETALNYQIKIHRESNGKAS